MARDTSRIAYDEVQSNGIAQTQRDNVCDALRKYKEPLTRRELSYRSGYPINIITGRINELIKANIVSEGDRRQCSISKHQAYTVYVTGDQQ